jgi:YVTN family beta-propeller protein
VAIDPSGQFAYIIRGALSPGLSVRQTSDGSEVTSNSMKSPRYVVANATDVWMTDSGRTATTGQVVRYSRSAGDIVDSIEVGNNPYGIDINSAGTFLYVSNRDGNSVSKINIATKAVTTIAVGSQPRGIKVTPDGSKVFVANMGGTTVSVINTSTNAVSTISGFNAPAGLAITAAGDLLYVANSGNNTVQLVTVATNAMAGAAIPVGTKPMHIALRNAP